MTFNILITGASGYIGGSVLSSLLRSSNAARYNISVLVRNKEHHDTFSAAGLNTITFSSLDDIDVISKAASKNQVVINCANSANVNCASALINGLSEYKKTTGKQTFYIHTSGTSNIADHAKGNSEYTRIFSDLEDIYSWQKEQNKKEEQSNRTNDINVVESGLAQGVKTFIIIPPLVYGPGQGNFNKLSVQVPTFVRLAIKDGQAKVIGQGLSSWNHIEVSDLADLFETLVRKVLTGDEPEAPSGKEGYYFVQSGSQTWLQLSQYIAKHLKKLDLVQDDQVASIDLEEASNLTGIPPYKLDSVFSSNARVRDEKARQLGWAPKRENFEGHFKAEIQATLEKYK